VIVGAAVVTGNGRGPRYLVGVQPWADEQSSRSSISCIPHPATRGRCRQRRNDLATGRRGWPGYVLSLLRKGPNGQGAPSQRMALLQRTRCSFSARFPASKDFSRSPDERRDGRFPGSPILACCRLPGITQWRSGQPAPGLQLREQRRFCTGFPLSPTGGHHLQGVMGQRCSDVKSV
jgi:hypothetical protein